MGVRDAHETERDSLLYSTTLDGQHEHSGRPSTGTPDLFVVVGDYTLV